MVYRKGHTDNSIVDGWCYVNDSYMGDWTRKYMQMVKWLISACIVLCGISLSPEAMDVEPKRHIIMCVMALLLCPKVKVHPFALGFLVCVAASFSVCTNTSEWLFWMLRATMFVYILSAIDLDEKQIIKTMMVIGSVFAIYFLYDCRVFIEHMKLRGSWDVFYSIKAVGFDGFRGMSAQRNWWAHAQFFIIPFCYRAYHKGYWKYLSVFLMVAMTVNIIALQSRSGILALLVFTAVLVYKSRNKRALLLIPISAIVAFFLPIESLTSLESLGYRIEQWMASLRMAIDYPIGCGVGNWWIMFPKYAMDMSYPGAHTTEIFRFPHNDFVWILAEVGLAGLICYLGMFVSAIRSTKKTYLIAGLFSYMAIAFFSAPHERPFSTLVLIIMLALCHKESKRYSVNWIVGILVFAMVVFGFRYRASVYNKNIVKMDISNISCEYIEGGSVFSTLTYTGFPWQWWKATKSLQVGDIESASVQFKKAYRQNPNNVYVLNGMGMATAMDGDLKGSEVYFQQALDIAPDFQEAQINIKEVQDGHKNSNSQ